MTGSDLYYFNVDCLLASTKRRITIQSRFSNDADALSAAHVLADGVAFCGASDIDVEIVGAGLRDIGRVSDLIGNPDARVERGGLPGADFQA